MNMLRWKKDNDRLQRLKDKYAKLMKKAYYIAPKNKEKSDYLNREARKILQEVKRLEINHLH